MYMYIDLCVSKLDVADKSLTNHSKQDPDFILCIYLPVEEIGCVFGDI